LKLDLACSQLCGAGTGELDNICGVYSDDRPGWSDEPRRRHGDITGAAADVEQPHARAADRRRSVHVRCGGGRCGPLGPPQTVRGRRYATIRANSPPSATACQTSHSRTLRYCDPRSSVPLSAIAEPHRQATLPSPQRGIFMRQRQRSWLAGDATGVVRDVFVSRRFPWGFP
jgi:hypothetical protein